MISDIIKTLDKAVLDYMKQHPPKDEHSFGIHQGAGAVHQIYKDLLPKALNRVLDDIPIYEIGEIPDPSNVLSYTKELIEHINNYRK